MKYPIKSVLKTSLILVAFCQAQSGYTQNPTEEALEFDLKNDHQYVFNPKDLNAIGQQAVQEVDEFFKGTRPQVATKLASDYFEKSDAQDPDLLTAFRTEIILDRIQQILMEKNPDKILENSDWSWNNVGDIYGRIKILYCSMNEYVALFGTQLPQEGFSGVYSSMFVYDIMVTGEMKSHGNSSEDAFPMTYRAGDISLLKKADSRFYNMGKYTYMIDYGRGNIATAVPQGIIEPYLFSNHDYASLRDQLKNCGTSVVMHLLGRMKLLGINLN
jgi:hypothetical protein